MKNLGLLLLGSAVLPLLTIIIFFMVQVDDSPGHPAVVISIEQEATQIEATLTAEAAVYQAQVTALQRTLRQQEESYQTQAQALQTQIKQAEQKLADLQSQTQSLEIDISRLELTRTLQTERDQAAEQQRQAAHQARLTELRSQLQTLQTQLEQAQAALDRRQQ